MDSREKQFRQRTDEEGEGDDVEVELDPIDDDEGQTLLLAAAHTDNSIILSDHLIEILHNYLMN